MASEPWYPIGHNDVFPEEFGYFLLGNPRVRAAFLKYHADLLDPLWWQAVRDRASQGRIEDIFPYDDTRRLSHFFTKTARGAIQLPRFSGAHHV